MKTTIKGQVGYLQNSVHGSVATIERFYDPVLDTSGSSESHYVLEQQKKSLYLFVINQHHTTQSCYASSNAKH